jgi:energy-coupling factor transporter transmembrane protein EcfT
VNRAAEWRGLARLALFLGAGVAIALIGGIRWLAGLALVLVLVAWRCRLPRVQVGLVAWVTLAPLPGLALLFLLSGREATGAWGPGLAWGMVRLAPYSLRIFCLTLANLVFVHRTSLPELLALLARLGLPDRAALMGAVLVRFLPTALGEVRRVLEVQRSRGLDRRRLLTPDGLLALAVPLFLAQVQRSHDLALALAIRRGGSGRGDPGSVEGRA